MLWPIVALVVGIILLVISADKFVDGAASTANRFGMPPLLIGMLVLGFGSSTPEMVISTLAAYQGNPGLAIGNALGSNITNIALIIGLTALIHPIAVQSSVLKREFPYLIAITAFAFFILYDSELSRMNGLSLLVIFLVLIIWTIYERLKHPSDILAQEVEAELHEPLSTARANSYLLLGLVFLVLSSQLLVWGGVEVARSIGISDLVIGLTIVAIGTSLPELAATITAIKKGEDDLALGNIIGSNMFNTTIVLGIAATIAPIQVDTELLTRDLPTMAFLTLALFLMGAPIGNRPGRINRYEGATLLFVYLGYNAYLAYTSIQ